MDSVRIWDLTNAGRRGKKVDILAVYDLGGLEGNDIARHKFDEWLNWAAKRQTFDKTIRGLKILLEELSRSMSYMPKMQITQEKGVRVDPPQSVARRVKFTPLDTPERVITVEAKPSDVSIRQVIHRVNDKGERQFYLHDEVVSNTRKKRETRALYNWVVANEAKLKKVKSLRDVTSLLNAEDIPYRTYYLD